MDWKKSPEKGVYAQPVRSHVNLGTVIEMMTSYASMMDEAGSHGTWVLDMRVNSVHTGYGSYTTRHLEDSDYIVHFGVLYSDRSYWCEAIYGTHNGEITLWAN